MMIQHNYTGYGWEGDMYQQTKELSTAEIAKRIRKEVMYQFPNIKVSLRTKYYSGGSSITLKVLDFGFDPLTEQYRAYCKTDRSLCFEDWCGNRSMAKQYIREAESILDELKAIGNKYRYQDTDSQIDYFDTNFYYFVGA